MKPDRWQQIDKLFQAALEIQPAQRAAFLDDACAADVSLRKEVEALLASDEQAGSFIVSPAIEAAVELMAENQSHQLAGKSIGPYHIISRLGAGGMGEVYLAQDNRLGRKVALKLLPDYFIKDQARLRRFQQEARAASSLNHPNIITIFDIGEFDSTHFIATEYIEGATLRSALSRGVKLDRALDIAIQVASALAPAHQAGIVHRDIKPENIMLRSDGYVKVLDFGLAKLTEKQSLTSDTEAATIAKISTDPGTVMGTVSYMGPEQARGRDVDARTDIFSLGVVLYEMVAGRVPFEGESASDVIAAILDREPAPLARFVPEAPTELQRILTKALRKEKDARYQLVHDLFNDLKELKQELEHQARLERNAAPPTGSGAAIKTRSEHGAIETAAGAALQTADAAAIRTTSSAEYILSEIKRHKTGVSLTLVALVFTTGAAFALYKFFGRGQPLARFQNTQVKRIFSTGVMPDTSAADISPDGKYVVAAVYDRDEVKGSLVVRQLASNSAVQVVPPVAGIFQASTFSHDGNFIYYVLSDVKDWNNQKTALYRVPAIGGTSVKLVEDVWSPIALSPDDKQMAYVRRGSLLIANADGSDERTLAEWKGEDWFLRDGASWSPDGKLIACGFHGDTVVVVSVNDGKIDRFTSHTWSSDLSVGRVVWLPDGSGMLVMAPSGRLDSQIVSLSYPGGEARSVTNDTGTYDPRSLGVTADGGSIVATQQAGATNIWVTSLGDEAGRARQLTVGRGDGYFGFSWTPDGRILYDSVTGDFVDIWVTNADGTGQRQLTLDHRSSQPFATADGRYIVYSHELDDNRARVWRMDADGSNPRPLLKVEKGVWSNVLGVSPDGQWVFVGNAQGTSRVSIDGGEPQFLSNASSNRVGVSPNGKMFVCLYYDKETSPPRNRVAIFSTEDGKLMKVFDPPNFFISGFGQLAWTPDGRGIVHGELHNNIFDLWSYPLDGGSPQQLTHFIEKAQGIRTFAFSPDGKQVALSRGPETGDVVLIKDLKTAATDKN